MENFIWIIKILKNYKYLKHGFLTDSVEQTWLQLKILLWLLMPEYVCRNLHSI